MSELDHYLLRSEKCLAQVRRHWAILAPQFTVIGLAWIFWLVILNASSSDLVAEIAAFFFLFSGLWLTWLVADWYRERFAVTNKRVLLVSGLFTKKLAVMPLSKVTDMTYERSPLGRLLGYGTFIMESAGQDQALSRVDFVQYPQQLYFKLTEELFGSDDWAARDGVAPRPPSPPSRGSALRTDLGGPVRLWELGQLWRGRSRGRRGAEAQAGRPPTQRTPRAGGAGPDGASGSGGSRARSTFPSGSSAQGSRDASALPNSGSTPSYPGSAPPDAGSAPSYPGSAPPNSGSAPPDAGSAPSHPGSAPSQPRPAPSDPRFAPPDRRSAPAWSVSPRTSEPWPKGRPGEGEAASGGTGRASRLWRRRRQAPPPRRQDGEETTRLPHIP